MTSSLSAVAAAMLEKVRRYDHVSYVELERVAAAHGIETDGDWAVIPNEKYPTIVAWAGVSEAFIDALDEIQPYIELVPTTPLVYLIDGKVLTYPIAKRAHHYKNVRWAPVCFRPKPGDGKREAA